MNKRGYPPSGCRTSTAVPNREATWIDEIPGAILIVAAIALALFGPF